MDFRRFKVMLEPVEDEINACLKGEPQRLYDACLHITSAGGKRIRPLICLISCEAVGGKTENTIKTAAALELLHTFTLVHDDIMDDDELRRNKPTVHKAYGMPTAILAGDLLFAKAFELCESSVSKILANTASEICEGQEMDMLFAERRDVKEDEYFEMIRKKTAVLLEASAEVGALLGGGSVNEVKMLAEYGRNLGLAFQIHDDVLDITADEDKLGKPIGSDIAEGKSSLVSIKALSSLHPKKRNRLLDILNKKEKTRGDISEAIDLIKGSGAIDYCRNKAQQLNKSAKESIKSLPENEAKKILLELSDFVVTREM